MAFEEFLSSPWFYYGLLPLLIFLSRVLDVSIGTIRVIFVSKGFKHIAPILGFFEVMIWLMAIQQIMKNLDNFVCYIAYAAGFAVGTYVGIMLEEKISIGKVLVRIVTRADASQLLAELKNSKFRATSMGADGPDGSVRLIICVIDKKEVPELIKIIKDFNPTAFYTIEDVRYVHDFEKHVNPSNTEIKKKSNHIGFLRKFK